MNLRQLRLAVDRVDDRLVDLLNERARLALQIGRSKREQGTAVYDPAREAEVLARVRKRTRAAGPLDEQAIGRLFERIIDEARQIELRDANSREDHAEGEDDGRRDGRTGVRGTARTRHRRAG